MPWTFMGPVEDSVIAALPFPSAQRLLSVGAPTGRNIRATCEWHGTGSNGDPTLGSFALALDGGPLDGLVGERLRIAVGRRIVYAFCKASADLDEDLSVTRRLFMALAPLDTTAIDVTVAVWT